MQKYRIVIAVVGVSVENFPSFKDGLVADLMATHPACELHFEHYMSARMALRATTRTELDILYIENQLQADPGHLTIAVCDLALSMGRNRGNPWAVIAPGLKTELQCVFSAAGVPAYCDDVLATVIGNRYRRYASLEPSKRRKSGDIDMSSYAGSHVYP